MEILLAGAVIRLLGRFHPLVIHFPIAFLLVAAAMEVVGMLWKRLFYPEAQYVCLTVGAAGALVAAPLGWADAASLRFGPEDTLALGLHRWLETSVAASSIAIWLLGARLRTGSMPRFHRTFQVLLLAAAAALGIGAHFGGILVYGHDYYASALENPQAPSSSSSSTPASATPGAKVVFRDLQPIFEAHCLRCHGASKQKAALRLDSQESVLKGGKSGPAVIPGNSAGSILYKAITDPNPDTRMPQESAPLADPEIRRIQSWIDQGAH